ncbi:twin-arginine translocation signal domain-containing protein, partial [Lutibacter aestuarii]
MKSRRNFIKNTAIAGAGLTLLPNMSFGLNSNVFGKDQKIRVGMIGVGLRGTNHLNNVLLRNDVLVTAICDIDPNRISIALDRIEKA